MEKQRIPHVSMREFLRSGQLGPFQPGDSIESLRNAFGEPHAVGGTSRRHRTPRIWKYGDIEFHLTSDTKHVWLIYCETFERLELGLEALFDHWFFEGHPSVESVEQELERASLTFCREDMPYEPTGFLLHLASGVELMFSYGTDPYVWPGVPGLFGFSHKGKIAT